jgi:hypothetical protein
LEDIGVENDNIKMDRQKIRWEVEDWTHVAPDRDQWETIVNVVMNFKVPLNVGNCQQRVVYITNVKTKARTKTRTTLKCNPRQ